LRIGSQKGIISPDLYPIADILACIFSCHSPIDLARRASRLPDIAK
jgi:hypothetical protein